MRVIHEYKMKCVFCLSASAFRGGHIRGGHIRDEGELRSDDGMDWSGGMIPSMLSRTRGWRVFLSSVNGVPLHAVLHDLFRMTGKIEKC